jgi:phosphocarrier protein
MKKTFVIRNDEGIHARPATLLVRKANQYTSDISITFNGFTTDLKSIMSVLSLGIEKGSLITIEAVGDDEVDAIKGITELMNHIALQ